MSSPDKQLTRLQARAALRENEHFIVEPIFPNGAMHCISGPPDVGKTTWLLQLLYDWSNGRPVLNCKSNPCEWVYVALDRSLRDTDRTMRRLGYGDWDAPVYSMEEVIPRNAQNKIDMEPQLSHIITKFPKARLIVLEGLQGFMPNTGRGQSLNKAQIMWFLQVRDTYLNSGGTILAVNHTPKSSDAAHDREDQLGSQGLIGGLGTVIKFNLPPDETTGKAKGMLGQTQTSDRLVTIMPKNTPPLYLTYTRADNGAFELESKSEVRANSNTLSSELFETEKDQILRMDMRLIAYEGQREIPLKQMKQWSREVGFSESQMFAWIQKCKTAGILLCEGTGKYRRSGTYR